MARQSKADREAEAAAETAAADAQATADAETEAGKVEAGPSDLEQSVAAVDTSTLLGDAPERGAAELEQGYAGDKVDPIANEAYSLETGPDAPVVVTAPARAAVAGEDPDEADHDA